MARFSLWSKNRLPIFIACGLLLSILLGQLTSYLVIRKQASFVLKSVIDSALTQDNSPNFAGYLRILYSSLKANSEGSGRLTVVLCRGGDIVASAPRWINAATSLSCTVSPEKSLWKVRIGEFLPFQEVPTFAVAQLELSPWNRYAMIVTLLLWLTGIIIVLWVTRVTFERKRISSMLDHLEEALLSEPEATERKTLNWSKQTGAMVEERLSNLKTTVEQTQKEYADAKSEAEVGRIARQAAHDIRAPLAVIDFISRDLSQVPESERVLLRKAMNRFREIADDLLYLGRKPVKGDVGTSALRESTNVQSLQGIVQEIVSERQVQFKSISSLKISVKVDADQYAKFVQVDAGILKRVISNLINNSIEAMNSQGEIELSIHEHSRESGRKLIVRVSDNGPGMPSELISRLGKSKVSFGKEGGLGLGLFHAHHALAAWAGEVHIRSNPGKGTQIDLEIPEVDPPSWFCLGIEIPSSNELVILDDDPLIHSIWEQRFSRKPWDSQAAIKVRHFYNSVDFLEWFHEKQGLQGGNESLFLFDFELANEKESGFDLIERLSLRESAILVTNQYEDNALAERCIQQKCRLLPKLLAPIVPITYGKTREDLSVNERPGLTAELGCDAVFIEDDEVMRSTWEMYAEEAGKKLRTFERAEDFLKVENRFDRNTPIYLDSCLSPGMSGMEAAKELRGRGFKCLGLATGFPKKDFPPSPWIDFVMGKEPPWTLPLNGSSSIKYGQK